MKKNRSANPDFLPWFTGNDDDDAPAADDAAVSDGDGGDVSVETSTDEKSFLRKGEK